MKTPLAASLLISVVHLLAPGVSATPIQTPPCPGGQSFDDGTAERLLPFLYAGPIDLYFESHFTPPSLPYTYSSVCLYLSGANPGPDSFEVMLFDDNGPGGNPKTILKRVPVTRDLPFAPEWVQVGLGCEQVTSGSIWIGVRFPAGSGVHVGADTNSANPFRWLEYDSLPGGLPDLWSGTYANLGPAALMVRAQGAPGGAGQATLRTGSGVNPSCYSAPPPSIGRTWTGRVNHGSSALQTRIYFVAEPASGPIRSFGELLVDLSSPHYLVSVKSSTGNVDLHSFLIPEDPALIGLTTATQALVVDPAGSGMRLCNAIDLTIGC